MFTTAEADACRRLIDLALPEDLGAQRRSHQPSRPPAGVARPRRFGRAASRRRRRLAGPRLTFAIVDPQLVFQEVVPDGSAVLPGAVLAVVSGSMRRSWQESGRR